MHKQIRTLQTHTFLKCSSTNANRPSSRGPRRRTKTKVEASVSAHTLSHIHTSIISSHHRMQHAPTSPYFHPRSFLLSSPLIPFSFISLPSLTLFFLTSLVSSTQLPSFCLFLSWYFLTPTSFVSSPLLYSCIIPSPSTSSPLTLVFVRSSPKLPPSIFLLLSPES